MADLDSRPWGGLTLGLDGECGEASGRRTKCSHPTPSPTTFPPLRYQTQTRYPPQWLSTSQKNERLETRGPLNSAHAEYVYTKYIYLYSAVLRGMMSFIYSKIRGGGEPLPGNTKRKVAIEHMVVPDRPAPSFNLKLTRGT